MEDLESFWTFHESNANFEVDELKQKLHYTAYELELARKEASEEIRKSNDHIKQLLQVIQTTCKERDEAKAQLKEFQQIMAISKSNWGTVTQYGPTEVGSRFNKLNNVVNNQIVPTTVFPAAPFSPDSPLLTTNNFPRKTNSSVTESSSFSLETQTNNNVNNPQFYVSSPVVDSLSSPDSSNIVNFSTPVVAKPATLPTKVVDKESLIISTLAKGRPLPPKGQLLQAVIEAGPLLSTLIVAGSLPQWRNPPGTLTHQIPPVNLKGCGVAGAGPSPGLSPSQGTGVTSYNKQNVMPIANVSTSTTHNDHVTYATTSGSIGICPSSMLNFGSRSCFMVNSGVSLDCQIPKRQRII